MAVPKKRRSGMMVRTRRTTQKLKRIENVIKCELCLGWYVRHNNHECK